VITTSDLCRAHGQALDIIKLHQLFRQDHLGELHSLQIIKPEDFFHCYMNRQFLQPPKDHLKPTFTPFTSA